MTWKDKLKPANLKIAANVSDKADEVLARYLPQVRQLFTEKFGPAFSNTVSDDGKMTTVAKMIYNILPFVARVAVKEETFVRFCLANRDKMLTTAVPIAPPAASLIDRRPVPPPLPDLPEA